jgi:hypothetical protein
MFLSRTLLIGRMQDQNPPAADIGSDKRRKLEVLWPYDFQYDTLPFELPGSFYLERLRRLWYVSDILMAEESESLKIYCRYSIII